MHTIKSFPITGGAIAKLSALVLASALVALWFTVATAPTPHKPLLIAAGETEVRLIQDEHEMIADRVRADLAARQNAADRARAEMTVSAQTTSVVQAAKVARPIAAAPISVIAPAAKPALTAGPPLQLQAEAPQAPRQKGLQPARAALAAVGRVPALVRTGVQNVAEWVIDPIKDIVRLPERRFL
jgi:hypothetical protein